jgi:acetylornithine deacetylase/succinyl-diaminopimelate desuccinylase-like protein
MGTPDGTEKSLRAFIDANHQEQVQFLADMVRVPTDNPPGDCAPHAERTARLLEKIGPRVERHPVPTDAAGANAMLSATNLVVRRRFGNGPVIALNAHGDVVPPGEGWTRDPYGAEIVDGEMYGRGVAVSKSDFATYTWAMLALETVAEGLGGTVELHFTYDEETGGTIGPQWLLEKGITRLDYAVSAGFGYGVITAHNGCLHLEAEVRGRQAHAAMPHTGVDALEAATGVLAAIYEYRARCGETRSQVAGIGSPTVVVGLIEGGVNTNVVPDLVRLRIDRRMIPEEDADAVEAEIVALIEEAAARTPGASSSVRRILLAQPLVPLSGTDRIAGDRWPGTPRRSWAKRSRPAAPPSTPTPAITPRRAFRRCSMAPGRAPSANPTPTPPTST